MLGNEHQYNKRLSKFERIYIKLFGYPALGLHVRVSAIKRYLKLINNPLRILDAGCGSGVLTFECAKLYKQADILGIDNRQTVVDENNEIAKKLQLYNCSFKNLDLFNLSKNESYDFILSTDNLEHMDDDDDLLLLFNKILSSNGKLLLHVPHMTRKIFGFKRTNFMGIEGHVRPGYYRNDLEVKVKNAGFKVIKSSYSYNSFETLFNDISYLITGGREKNKYLYALVFPLLLILTKFLSFWPTGEGSGVTLLAEKIGDVS